MTPPAAVRVRRIACLLVPDFPVAIERLDRPELARRPVVIGGAPEERKAVLACSAEARAGGVRVGLSLREALARCPAAVILEARHVRYDEVAEAINRALGQLSPLIEPVAPGETLVGLDGLTLLHGGEAPLAKAMLRDGERALAGGRPFARGTLPVCLGVGAGKFTARVAAMLAKPGRPQVVTAEATAPFLAQLPVSVLPVEAAMHDRLAVFGLRRLGDLAALPLSAVQAEFGPAGRRAWELARGLDTSPLYPRDFPSLLRERLGFEQPVTSGEVITLAMRRLLDRLVAHPLFRYRAARGARVRLTQTDGQSWERAVTFRQALSDPRRIFTAFQGKLATLTLSAPVEEVVLTLTDLCAEGGVQEILPLSERVVQIKELREAVRQLKAHYGVSPVAQIVEVDPWSRLPERRRALIDYDP